VNAGSSLLTRSSLGSGSHICSIGAWFCLHGFNMARLEGACVEDFGAFGNSVVDVVQSIAAAAFGGEGQVTDRNLLKWQAAQHLGATWRARRLRDLGPELRAA
jgi:hypothetical protein